MSEQQPIGQPQGTPPTPPAYPGQPGQRSGGLHSPAPQSQPENGQAGHPQLGHVQYGAPYDPAVPHYPSAPGSPADPTRERGALGRVAFIVALVSLGVGLLVTLTFPLLTRTVDYSTTAIGAVTAVGNGFVFVIALVALVLGLMAVRRPRQQILAGIAIGIAGSEIAGLLISWVTNAFLSLQYL